LVEEIVRLYGFENIEGVLPTLPITPPQKNELRDLEWKVRDFCAAMGFLEVYNYSFASEIDQNFEPNKSHVEVQNPLSGDQKYLRTNLISNFVKNCESELRTHGKLDFFEFGNIFEKVDNQVLPNETKHLALFSAGMGNAENEDFFRLKAEISRVFELLEVKAEFRPCAEPKQYFHPSKSADIFIDGELVGEIATLHPQFTTIKNSFINFCEINAEKLLKSSQKSNILYQEISSFPSVYRDLSIVLNDRTLISDIEKVCFESATYLKKIELFDEFFDPIKLGKNLKNLAFHLSFKSDERTLNEQEIDENFNQIVKNLNSKFNAKLRLEFDKEKNS
ncbi:MAG: hypothetical protein OEL89_04140, partial [Candidatus Peregrinibacteria bacterium]|nr:hypothetical protein [Candidatus Peregrinibacteria bacterium]